MKNFILSLLFCCVFQNTIASDNIIKFEKIINSTDKTSDQKNLREIVNFLSNNYIDYSEISKIYIKQSKKKYLTFTKGYILYVNNDFENASTYFYSIFYSIFENNNFDDQYILFHFLYDIENALGNDSNALYFLNKIKNLYIKTKNINYYYFYLVEKGVCYRNTKQYDNALKLFKEAKIIYPKITEKTKFDWLNLHQGRTYLEKEDYSKAKYYYDLCFNNYKKTKLNDKILYVLYDYFLIDYKKGDYDKAIEKANDMIEIASKDNNIDKYMLTHLYNKMGEIYKNFDSKKAILCFEKALNLGLETKQNEGVYEACLNLLQFQNISISNQKKITSFLSYNKENENRKMIKNINSSERLNNILNYENNLKEQKKYLIYYIVFIFFSFLFLIILMIFYVKQKKSLLIISNQKEELSKQNYVLSKYNAMINQKYEKIENLNNTLAHDIKSGIISIKEIAKGCSIINSDPKFYNASQKIIDETNSLSDTINFLLDNANSSKNSSVETEKIDWNKILDLAKNSLDHLILLTHPTIILNEDLPNFMGYKTHFYQIFKNLIENSLKYSDPSRNCEISISIKKDKKNVLHIDYIDNGIGIEKENLTKIFEFFNQSKFEHISKGYGIGLGICKKIVDSYNGKITVTSTPNKGTKFIIIMNELTK